MASPYPTSFDSFTAQVDGVDQADAADINDLQSAIDKIEHFVGINGSADNTTLDYKLKNTGSQDPGHKHTKNSIISVTEAQVEDGSLLARLAAAETVAGAWQFDNYLTIKNGYGQLPSNAAHLVIGAGGVSGGNRVTMLFGSMAAADKMLIGTNNAGSIAPIMTLTANVKSVNFHGDIGSSSVLCIRPGDNGSNHTQLSGIVDFMPALAGTPYITLNGTGASALSAKLSIGLGTNSPAAQLHVRGIGPIDAYFYSGFATGSMLFLEDGNNLTGGGGGIVFGGTGDSKYFAAIKSSLTLNTYNTVGDLIFAVRAVTGFGSNTTLTEAMRVSSLGPAFVTVGPEDTPVLTQLTVGGLSGFVAADAAVAVPSNLVDWTGGTLCLTDSQNTGENGYGGMLLFGNGLKHAAAIRYVQANAASNTRGQLAFCIRKNAAETTLTEIMRLYSSGTFVGIGVGTTIPATLLDVNGSLHATQCVIGPGVVPNTTLQVEGDFSMVPVDVAVSGATVHELDPGTGSSVIRITGGTQDFTLTGTKYGALGKMLTIINATGYQMTIAHEHTGSGQLRRFYLSELANLQLAGASGASVAVFVWATSPLGNRWILVSARSNSAVASTRAK